MSKRKNRWDDNLYDDDYGCAGVVGVVITVATLVVVVLGTISRVGGDRSAHLPLAPATPSPTVPVVVPIYPTRHEECLIKGNVSYGTGEKIYHMPGQKYYDETKINTQYGERWFCSEEDAKAAGWRRARE